MGYYTPWHGPNKELGRAGPNRLDVQQIGIGKNTMLGALFIFDVFEESSEAFLARGFYYWDVFGQHILPVHFR